jgi:hypothetical protein
VPATSGGPGAPGAGDGGGAPLPGSWLVASAVGDTLLLPLLTYLTVAALGVAGIRWTASRHRGFATQPDDAR